MNVFSWQRTSERKHVHFTPLLPEIQPVEMIYICRNGGKYGIHSTPLALFSLWLDNQSLYPLSLPSNSFTPFPPSPLTCVSPHPPESFLSLLCLHLVPPLPTLLLLLTLTHKCWKLRHWSLLYPLTIRPLNQGSSSTVTHNTWRNIFQKLYHCTTIPILKKTRTCASEWLRGKSTQQSCLVLHYWLYS